MFDKILIANRGEIACRIIRTARRMGIATVALYSEADRHALHVAMADEAVFIGPAPSRDSYLRTDKVIEAALRTGAQAIHPGYGFLSENAEFCELCKENNLVFIGPPIGAIRAMGSKSAAKEIMEAAGVPLVPGYHGKDQSPEILKKISNEMGYPVLLKATAGGGGKGMRQVWAEAEFDEALAAAKRESASSFGNDDMLVEKYLTEPRHVEIQVFCDQSGNGVYLFERDCSVQRRHQKVIEEAPAPGLTKALRTAMGETALKSAQAIKYEGAGTVEFLLNPDGSFYFMEMNTRLQVEHPVTEMISGQDLVEWQLRVAAGQPLPLTQDQLQINGHAFEARIYAEDPDNDFLPVTGHLSFLQPPEENEHVRVDTGVIQGDDVSPFYDPMIAKLIVWDENRDRALARLTSALSEYRISGVTTNIEFLYNLANCEAFRKAQLDTNFIEKHRQSIFHGIESDVSHHLPLIALFLILEQQRAASELALRSNDPWSPWSQTNAWRLNEAHIHNLRVTVNDQQHSIDVEEKYSPAGNSYIITTAKRAMVVSGQLSGNELHADIEGHRIKATVVAHQGNFSLFTQNQALLFSLELPDYGDTENDSAAGGLIAPMNGTIVTLLVDSGATVEKDQALLVMEAMKMEHTIRAPESGTVAEFYYQPGDLVDGGASLLSFEPDPQ